MAADEQKVVAVAALYYFLEMQSNHFLQTASYMEPFTSSKVELIMSAWKERNEANRCKNYVEHVVPTYTLDEFQQHFRLKRGTFEILITNTNVITAIFLFCDSIQIINDPWLECFRIMFLFWLNKTTNHKPDSESCSGFG